jgi:hypothetical protein
VYGDASASSGRELSQSEAFQFEKKIRADVAEIRKDFQELISLKNVYDVELARLKSLQAQIRLSGGG